MKMPSLNEIMLHRDTFTHILQYLLESTSSAYPSLALVSKQFNAIAIDIYYRLRRTQLQISRAVKCLTMKDSQNVTRGCTLADAERSMQEYFAADDRTFYQTFATTFTIYSPNPIYQSCIVIVRHAEYVKYTFLPQWDDPGNSHLAAVYNEHDIVINSESHWAMITHLLPGLIPPGGQL